MQVLDQYSYNSVEVAKYIVATANERHLGINMTKLQKLLYIVYGAFLVIYPDRGRLTNEHPQAWPFGPVFPTTRNKLIKIDLSSITKSDVGELQNDKQLEFLVDFVFEEFGTWNASQLTEWSHREGTPWHKTTEMDMFKWGMQIPDEYIAEFFNQIIRFEAA